MADECNNSKPTWLYEFRLSDYVSIILKKFSGEKISIVQNRNNSSIR